mgnify:CR=1 FL=1
MDERRMNGISVLPILHKMELGLYQQTTYCFKAHYILDSTTGFSFPKNTYLHGCWLKEIDKTLFFQTYPILDFHYEIKGVLDNKELNSIIECFKNSPSVKRRIKKIL